MKGSEFCSLDDGVDVGPTTSNFVDGPIVGRCTAMLPDSDPGRELARHATRFDLPFVRDCTVVRIGCCDHGTAGKCLITSN